MICWMAVCLMLGSVYTSPRGNYVDENGDPVTFRASLDLPKPSSNLDSTGVVAKLGITNLLENPDKKQAASPKDQGKPIFKPNQASLQPMDAPNPGGSKGPKDVGDQEKQQKFEAWLKGPAKVGGLDKLNITTVGDPPHRGTVALQDIEVGESFIHVPFTTMLTGESEEAERELGSIFHHDYNTAGKSPWFYSDGSPNLHRRLTLRLLLELKKGDRSFWKPYIDVLPREFSRPQDWTPAELQAIEGSVLAERAVERQKRKHDDYKEVFPLPEKEVKVPAELTKVSQAEWNWARDIVFTRAFGISHHGFRDIALVPLADLPNHNNVKVSWDYDNDRDYKMVANGTPFKKGQEVFISYGHHNNHELLSTYGFMLPANEYTLPKVCEDAKDTCIYKQLQKYPTSYEDTMAQLQLMLVKKDSSEPSFNMMNARKIVLEEKDVLLGI